MSKYTITRRKVQTKPPIELNKRKFRLQFYVNQVFAGCTYTQVHEFIYRMRLNEGYNDTPELLIVKEACEMTAFTDSTIIRVQKTWAVSME